MSTRKSRALKFPGFGQRCEEALRALQLTRKDLERRTGFAQGQISRWFSDVEMPGWENFQTLTKALERPWQWFVVGDWHPALAVHRVRTTYLNQEIHMPAPVFESLWPRIAHLYANGQENGKWKLFEDLLNQLVPPGSGALQADNGLTKTGTDHAKHGHRRKRR